MRPQIGGPGYLMNGTGLNGVYYDWTSRQYRDTQTGNSMNANFGGWHATSSGIMMPPGTEIGKKNGKLGFWRTEVKGTDQCRVGRPIVDPFEMEFEVEISHKFEMWNNTLSDGGSTPWMTAAEGQLGVTEIAGSIHNPNVIGYHATTGGFKDDETPWCSSFVNWSIKQAGIKGTNSARALSWSGWGQSLSNPAYGSIAIFDYGSGKGHVGFVVGVNSSGSIVLLGGNQSNMVRYSAFSPSSISGYAYPSGFSPNYTLPTIIINKAGGFSSTR